MKILAVSMGADLAGTQIGMTKAVNKVLGPEGYQMRSMATSRNYIRYPADMPWDETKVRRAWHEADVVHISQKLHYTVDRLGERGNIVIHHHGTKYREQHEALIEETRRRGAVPVVSTVDLLQYDEDAIWVPAPVDLQNMALRRTQGLSERFGAGSRRILIGHAPTDRGIKDTRAFQMAVGKLRRKHQVSPVLIERKDWNTCLARKAQLDIYYDQMQLGYGSNAVEAWAMGIPVVAGTTDVYTQQKMLSLWGEYPFVEASVDTIYDALERLLDVRERKLASERGLTHVKRYHSQEAVAGVLRGVYRRAAGLEDA